MVILAYDVQRVILFHFMPLGETVNAQHCVAYLQNHLRRAVRRKRLELQNMIICMIMLLHIRRRWRWEVLEHPPYSPDLSSCDYDLISKFKAPLRGQRFRTRDDIATAVRRLIMTNFRHGEADGIRRLPHR